MSDSSAMRQLFAVVLAVGFVACSAPKPPPPTVENKQPAPTPVDAGDTRPRCLQAGGICVGPAAIQANPTAPCAAGYHRVDDVPVPGTLPACLGIPMGEEACCMR